MVTDGKRKERSARRGDWRIRADGGGVEFFGSFDYAGDAEEFVAFGEGEEFYTLTTSVE